MLRKRIRPIIFWLIIIYFLPAITLQMFQKKLIFHPDALAADYKFKFDVPFDELKIPVKKDELLSAVLFKAKAPKGMVIYFHGNARNISDYASRTPDFTNQGYDVLMMDYPGYGKSTGPLTESKIYADGLLMYEIARQRFPADSIIIYGRSIGTGVAAQLASVRDCKQLILETPYYSLTSLTRRILWMYPLNMLMDYKFPAYTFIEEVTAPVTIFHGTSDGVIPYGNAENLKTVLKKGDKFLTIEGGGHNDLNEYPLFHEKLDSLLH